MRCSLNIFFKLCVSDTLVSLLIFLQSLTRCGKKTDDISFVESFLVIPYCPRREEWITRYLLLKWRKWIIILNHPPLLVRTTPPILPTKDLKHRSSIRACICPTASDWHSPQTSVAATCRWSPRKARLRTSFLQHSPIACVTLHLESVASLEL